MSQESLALDNSAPYSNINTNSRVGIFLTITFGDSVMVVLGPAICKN